MPPDPPAVLIFNGTVRLTVDADTAFDHPRCRGQVVDIVTTGEPPEPYVPPTIPGFPPPSP